MTSAELTTEINRILTVKFPDFLSDHMALRRTFASRTARVELGALTIDACRDPDDNRVLETAVLGGAASIVSGDKDLLGLDPFGSVRILRPHQWLHA